MHVASDVAHHRSATNGSIEARGFRGLGSAFAPLLRWIAQERTRRRTMRALGTLDDAALKDIGLHRCQLYGIEQHPRYSSPRERF